MKLPFELPPPEGSESAPIWDGKNFVYGEVCSPVLEYSENFEGWSDDLTALHEEVAGDSHPIDVASRRDAIEQVRKLALRPQTVIMEIGCSSGFLLRDLANSFPQAIVVGADVVKDPLYRLAESMPGIPLIRFDLLQCPLPECSVDVLIMLNVLEHIEEDEKALRAAHGLLKSGGILIIEVPASPSLYDSYDEELCHFRRYSAAELLDKLARAGFKVKRKSHLGFLVFPAFAAVKLLNKMLKVRKNRSLVRGQAGKSSESGLVRLAMRLESRWLSGASLPFGIRVLCVAEKHGVPITGRT